MKKRLNILCVLVIVVLGLSVSRSAYYFGLGAMVGIKGGFENRMNDLKTLTSMKTISVLPEDFLNLGDSLLNEKTHEYVPVMYNRLAVSIPVKEKRWEIFTSVLSTYIYMISAIVAFIIFILIIISVNKSEIFTWKNVSRLRWLGGLLVISFFGSVMPPIITYISLTKEFSLQGYTLSLDEIFSVFTLALGLLSYIFAEIFAIGLRMKEEQDLTI